MEVIAQHDGHTRVPRRLVVILERVSGDHPRPPIAVCGRTDVTILALMLEKPVYPFLRFALKRGIVQRVSQVDKTLIVVRATLPIFPRAAEPGAVGPEILVDPLGISRKAVALQLALLQQPASRPDTSQR